MISLILDGFITIKIVVLINFQKTVLLRFFQIFAKRIIFYQKRFEGVIFIANRIYGSNLVKNGLVLLS